MVLIFWILVTLLMAGAVAIIVIPLWRGGLRGGPGQSAFNLSVYRRELAELNQERATGAIDDPAYQEARLELERRVLEDVADAEEPDSVAGPTTATSPGRRIRLPLPALLVALILPAMTLLVYQQVGTSPSYIQALLSDPERLSELEFTTAMEGLISQVSRDPMNDVAWHMLGRGYARMGELEKAAEALSRVRELRGDDAGLLTELAQVEVMQRPDQSLAGRPRELLERALESDPDHSEALWLAGMAAAQAGDMAVTRKHWGRLLAQEDGSSAEADRLREALSMLSSGQEGARSGESGNPGEAIADPLDQKREGDDP